LKNEDKAAIVTQLVEIKDKNSFEHLNLNKSEEISFVKKLVG